jgi:hypothetical protein
MTKRRELHRRGSNAGEPIVTLVFPIATAGASREKIDLGQILDIFISELDRGVDPERSAVVGMQIMPIHPVGEQGLRM